MAPIIKLTLPKLELSAALLLAKLMATVKSALNVRIDKIFYFSDSEVTLAWIRGEPNRWKVFVANRIKEICQLSDKSDWRYVPSKENSADCASRGLLPEQLINFELWWHGPNFLKYEIAVTEEMEFQTEMEQKTEKIAMSAKIETENVIFARFSTLNRAKRVIAWCKKLANRIRGKSDVSQTIDADELVAARDTLVKLCQQEYFQEELDGLKNLGKCKKSS